MSFLAEVAKIADSLAASYEKLKQWIQSFVPSVEDVRLLLYYPSVRDCLFIQGASFGHDVQGLVAEELSASEDAASALVVSLTDFHLNRVEMTEKVFLFPY